jgi:Ni/Co efflux regulator RcnB
MNTNLKRLMTAAAAAVLFGTPALAANHAQRHDRTPQAPYAASQDQVNARDWTNPDRGPYPQAGSAAPTRR